MLIVRSLCAGWAEDLLPRLSQDEKIGQLFIVPACQLRGEDHLEDLNRMVHDLGVGGIILKQGTVSGQIALVNRLQERAKIPLICVADAEWGLSMRLFDTMNFPKNITLGAVQNEKLLFLLGQEIGRQCARVGIHINLAPVVDVNSNPDNPIIHRRSFGEDPFAVARKGVAFMQGVQNTGTFACAKHFPGHGDTVVDSHVDLPLVLSSLERLWNVELIPFQQMVEGGVAAVMSAHLCLPNACQENKPATFSQFAIQELLQKKMQFEGLILTDALNMQALELYYSASSIGLNALLAGHDMLLYGDHVAPNVDRILQWEIPQSIAGIKEALSRGILTEETLDRHVLKILKAKEKLHLNARSNIPEVLINDELFPQTALTLKRELYRQALTLLRNEKRILPLCQDWDKVILICDNGCDLFQKKMHERFSALAEARIGGSPFSASEDAVVVAALAPGPSRYLSAEVIDAASCYQKMGLPVVWIVFGTPYSLVNLPQGDAIILAYEVDPDAQEAAVDALAGSLTPKGRLPVTVPGKFVLGEGGERDL